MVARVLICHHGATVQLSRVVANSILSHNATSEPFVQATAQHLLLCHHKYVQFLLFCNAHMVCVNALKFHLSLALMFCHKRIPLQDIG